MGRGKRSSKPTRQPRQDHAARREQRRARPFRGPPQQDALPAEAIVLCIVGFLAIYCIEPAARIVVKKQEE
ncbi:MAG: hypothetical protein ACLT1W_13510 [Alistipes onderdonkii]